MKSHTKMMKLEKMKLNMMLFKRNITIYGAGSLLEQLKQKATKFLKLV